MSAGLPYQWRVRFRQAQEKAREDGRPFAAARAHAWATVQQERRQQLKQDLLGRHRRSPVTPPLSGFVAQTGLPDFDAVRLFDEQAAERALRQAIARRELTVARELSRSWGRMRRRATTARLGQGLDALEELDEVWTAEWTRMVNSELAPAWREMASAGSDWLALQAEQIQRGVRFDSGAWSQHVRDFVDQRSAELVRNITADQRSALQSLFRRYMIEEPVSPRAMRDLIRPLVGLTSRQTQWVRGRVDALAAGGATASQAEAAGAAFAERLRTHRATRIARTETALAYNIGTFARVRETDYGGARVVKEWWTALDERVCPFCGPLHGVVVELDDTYPMRNAEFDQEPYGLTPPAHPMCRCTLVYQVEDVEPQEPELPDPANVNSWTDEEVERWDQHVASQIEESRKELDERFGTAPRGADMQAYINDMRGRQGTVLRANVDVENNVSWPAARIVQETEDALSDYQGLVAESTQAWSARSIDFRVAESGRAYYSLADNRIRLYLDYYKPGPRSVRRILYHESSHWLEQEHPGVSAAARSYLWQRVRRANNGNLPSPVRLGPPYKGHERYMPAGFHDNYTSKVYAGSSPSDWRELRATEITSTAIEDLSDQWRALLLWRRDPEHFAYMHAVMTGRFNSP